MNFPSIYFYNIFRIYRKKNPKGFKTQEKHVTRLGENNLMEEALGRYGQIVREVKSKVSSLVTEEFIHEYRESNGDVHNLV